MKKPFTFFLFIVFSNTIISQNTLLFDINFEQELINLGLDTGTPNGNVPTANIDTLTYLNLYNLNINNIVGIEDFIALDTLYCGGNNLTSLNISNNINLKTFDCSSNSLTQLNVSSNINLLLLGCGFNLLNQLDISSNLNLIELYCRNNSLSNINILNHSNLGLLFCDNNQISNIDISNNLNLRVLACGNNLLNVLDVSYNANLESLDCRHSSLTVLDVSNNPNLEILHCNFNLLTNLNVSTNTMLERLFCGNNQLSTLNLSLNTALTHFDCSSNNNLYCLDLKNGNNSNTILGTYNNPNLTCIQIDDSLWSSTHWAVAFPNITFSENCPPCPFVGIDENSISNTLIYPNPTKDNITVDFKGVKNDVTATLINNLGQVIFMNKYTSTNLINLDLDAAKGIYLLQIQSGEEFKTYKILKE